MRNIQIKILNIFVMEAVSEIHFSFSGNSFNLM